MVEQNSLVTIYINLLTVQTVKITVTNIAVVMSRLGRGRDRQNSKKQKTVVYIINIW